MKNWYQIITPKAEVRYKCISEQEVEELRQLGNVVSPLNLDAAMVQKVLGLRAGVVSTPACSSSSSKSS